MGRSSVSHTPHYDIGATLFAALFVITTALHGPTAHAGKLERTRSATKGSSGTQSHDESHSIDHDDDDDNDIWIAACLLPFILPFCIAAIAHNERKSRTLRNREDAYFLSYPYADGQMGHLQRRGETRASSVEEVSREERFISNAGSTSDISVSTVTARFAGEYYYDLDTVHVPGISFAFDSTSRLGFDTHWRLFLEPLDNTVDKLVMGHLNLTVRLIQHPTSELHLGIGGRLLTGGTLTGGFNSSLRLVIFPIRPLTIKGLFQLGNLGPALFTEGQITLGATLLHMEWYAGYRGTLIHGRNDTISYHGPVVGMSVWW